MFEPGSGEDERESGALMAAPPVAIEFGRAAELGGDDDEGFVEEVLFLEVIHERGDAVVGVPDEFVLLELTFAVSVPTGAVEKAGVVGKLNEANAVLDEASREEAPLTKFAAVFVPEVCRFGVEVEVFHETGAGEAKGFSLGLLIIGERGHGWNVLFKSVEEIFSRFDPVCVDMFGAREAGGAGFHVGEINVAMVRSEEAGTPAHIGKANEHVGGNGWIGGTALMGHDGTDGRVGGGAAGGTSGVDEVRGDGVLVNEVVMTGTDGGDLFHAPGELREVLADFDSFDRGFDGGVIRSRDEGLFRAAFDLGIESVNLGHAAAQPDHDTVFRLALGMRGRRGIQSKSRK